MLFVVFFLIVVLEGSIASNMCTDANTEIVGRIVYGEGSGETATVKLAIAYTVVNRVRHIGYPNSVKSVTDEKFYGHHEYFTLDHPETDIQWAVSKRNNDEDYQIAHTAAVDALCGLRLDPSGCAVNFCGSPSCGAIQSSNCYEAYNNRLIGNLYFVCRRHLHKPEC